MAVAFRSASDVFGTGTNITPAEPTGAAQNDVLVALCIAGTLGSITKPTGWTTLYSGAAVSFNYELCWIARGASAPSYTFAISQSVFRQVTVAAFSGANTTSPFSASTNGGHAALTTNPDPPSASPGTVDGMAAAICAHWSSANPFVAPTGYTLRGNASASDIGYATKALSSTAAENPGAFTGPAEANDTYSATLLLQPSAASSNALAGTVAGASSVSGALAVIAAMQGALAGTSTIAGTLAIRAPLAGTVASTSTVTGTLTGGTPPPAASRSVLHPTFRDFRLRGDEDFWVASPVAVGGAVALAGAVAATSDVSGALVVDASLAGAVVSASTVAGTLTVSTGGSPTSQTFAPNTLLASSGLGTFALEDVDEDPATPDAAWAVATSNNVATSVRLGFPTPAGNPTGVQTFRARVRQTSTSGTGTPTARLELWENGVLVAAGTNQNVTVVGGDGQQISEAFDLAGLTLSDPTGASVEVLIVGTQSGGSPAVRSAVDIGAAAWDAIYTSSGPSPNPLAGTITGASVVSGALLVETALAGAVASDSTVSGTLSTQAQLAGAVSSASAVSGTITVARPLAGSIASASTATGTITVAKALAGTIASTSTVAGALTNTAGAVALAGTIASTSMVAGVLTARAGLAGTVAGTSTVSGTAVTSKPLAGTITSASTVAGAFVTRADLAGTVASASTLAGSVSVTKALAGTVASTSTVSGALTNTAPGASPLAGTVASTSTATGALTVHASLAGVIASASSTSGALTSRATLAGTVTSTSTAAGAVNVRASLSGAIASTSTVTGALTNQAPGSNALAGTISGTSTVSGTVLVTKPLAGVVASTTTVTGSLTSRVSLAASVTSTSTLSAALTVRHPLEGLVTSTSTVAGAVVVLRPLSGEVLAASSLAGTLTNRGPVTAVGRLEAGASVVFSEGAASSSVYESTSGVLALTE